MIMPRVTVNSQVDPVRYRVDEAAAALRLSRSSVYELIRSGQLRTVKHDRRRLVPVTLSRSTSHPWEVRFDSSSEG
jgi:excisionase family DNA binding protein